MENIKYELKYRFAKPEDNINENFALEDILSLLSKNDFNCEALEISHFFIEKDKRNLGYGSSILKSFCEAHDDKLIFLIAGVSEKEYEEEPTEEEYELVLKRLKIFYERLGFVDVNSNIGCYETRCSYVYKNEIGKDFTKAIKL